ncbi:MAG: Crp/Fnr family transcriptional regulator [Chloroflexi bacterium]|nr:Crp/Fnr family transcriptional regulator [Chloroflexota bacterium]
MFLKFSEQIAKDDVFSHLSTRDHEELERLAFHASYKKGQYICMQDDIWNRALYISSGKLGWVMLSPDGKRQVVFRMGPGRIVWGHSLFDGEPMPAALEVMEDCEVCIWEGDAIMPIVSRNVDAVWAITRKLVGTMRKVRNVVYGFAFHPVAGRLANLLLNHYKPAEGQAASRDLTLDEMAQTVGSTRELVSKTLHQFAGEGMIEISRVEITFTDRSKLEQLINE